MACIDAIRGLIGIPMIAKEISTFIPLKYMIDSLRVHCFVFQPRDKKPEGIIDIALTEPFPQRSMQDLLEIPEEELHGYYLIA